jgi:integrase
LRRSELVGLQVEDVVEVAGGLRLRIRRGKTDQTGQGAEIGLPRGRHVETCPVRAFHAWQAVARRKAGPLFITEAYNKDVRDEDIMRHTRHRDLRTMRGYVQRAGLVTESPAGALDL